MRKATFLLAGGVGYVLGTRAGRERYEQIRRAATRAWENPKVQQTVGDLEHKAADTARSTGSQLGSQLTSKASAAARTAYSTAQEKVSSTVGSRGKAKDGTPADFAASDTNYLQAQAGSNGHPS